MIQLLIIVVAILVVWLISNMLSRKPTIEEARTVGLQQANEHIQNPILLEDYAQARGIPSEDLYAWIEQGKIPAYHWRQYIYVENREPIFVKK